MGVEKCGFLTVLDIFLLLFLQLEGIWLYQEEEILGGGRNERRRGIEEQEGEKGQGRSELGKRDRGRGMEKGSGRLRRKQRKIYMREDGHSPFLAPPERMLVLFP